MSVKSIKAKEFIENTCNDLTMTEAITLSLYMDKAVELAEQEMIEKAVEAFLRQCKLVSGGCCYTDNELICEKTDFKYLHCEFLKHYINQLNS